MPPTDPVTPDMTLLDVMFRWRPSEEIFQAWELRAGACLLCHALFHTLEEAAREYHLDLGKLLAELNALARRLDCACRD